MKKIIPVFTAMALLTAATAHSRPVTTYSETAPSLKEEQDGPRDKLHQGGKTMTIKECMLYATENSLKLKSQKTLTEDARDSRVQAILQAFTPGISAGTYAYSNFGRSVDPETNTYVSTASFNNGYSISGSMMLFNGFEAVNNIRIAKTSVLMGADRERQLTDEICLAVIEAYCNVVYYGKMRDIIAGQARTAEESLQLAIRQEELGQKGHADVVQMQANLAETEYRLTNISNLHDDAMLTLKNLMSWPSGEPLEINAGIADTEAGVMARLPETETEAIYRNPSVAIARRTMENAVFELKKARWKFAPRLSLSAGWSTSYYTYPGQANYVPAPYLTQLRTNGGEYIQFSLSIPIYDRLGNIFNLRQKKNDRLRASLEYGQSLRDVEDEMARARQDTEGARAAFIQADRMARVQEEAYNLSRKKMEQGLISPLEFQKAADNWLNANAERLNALLKFRIKSSVLCYYNGTAYQDQDWNTGRL